MVAISFDALTPENAAEVHAFCEREAAYWTVPETTFRRFMLGDPQFSPALTLVARQGDKLLGFAAAAPRKWILFKQANLKAFIVSQEARRQGLGTQILDELEHRIRAQGLKRVEVMSGPPEYWTPGLDLRHTAALFFFKKHGFRQKRQRVNLTVDLARISHEPESQRGNYVYSRAKSQEKDEVIAFVKNQFGLGYWPAETALSFENAPVTTFLARESTSKKLVGWATHSCSFIGSFGPTGVLKEIRGGGIGGVLLQWCMHDLHTTFKQDQMIIRWVTGNTVKFYSKAVGAVISPIYAVLRKRL